MKPKYSIIICAKNEAKNLPWVLSGISMISKKLVNFEKILIDGNSSDETVQIAKEFDCRVYQDLGKGKGEAIRLGGKKASGDILILIDADGSHNPTDIIKLIQPIVKDNIDHVSGSRMLGGSEELYKDFGQFVRLIGSAIITLLINYTFSVRLTDCQNGFRAIKKKVFEKLDLKENITTIEQEMVIKTLKKGYKIVEVPTHEYERRSGNSKVIVWKYAPRYFYSCLKYLLQK